MLIAVYDGGPECLASHRAAAALHRYDGFAPGVIEVLVPMHVFHRRKNVIVHHTRSLPEIDRDRVGPIPVTSMARTLIDLGAVASADQVEEAFDGAERDRLVNRTQVQRRYEQLRAPDHPVLTIGSGPATALVTIVGTFGLTTTDSLASLHSPEAASVFGRSPLYSAPHR